MLVVALPVTVERLAQYGFAYRANLGQGAVAPAVGGGGARLEAVLCAPIGPGATLKYGSLVNARVVSLGPCRCEWTLCSPSNRKCQPIASRRASRKNTRSDHFCWAVAMTRASALARVAMRKVFGSAFKAGRFTRAAFQARLDSCPSA